jgi:hypothetical protein
MHRSFWTSFTVGADCLRSHPRSIYFTRFPVFSEFLEGGNTFVKLPAPYIISDVHDFSDLEPVAIETNNLYR